MTQTVKSGDAQIKIFYGSGWNGLEKVQEEVNDWLDESFVEIISLTPAMCSIGSPEEIYQGVTVTVFYRYIPADAA